MRSVLRQIPGGYLVKHRDGDLKYLVVFSSPEVMSSCMGCRSTCDASRTFP